MKKGFTLIELLFVMGIITILAGMGISQMSSSTEQAEITATIQTLQHMRQDQERNYSENNTYYDDIAAAQIKLDDEVNYGITLTTCASPAGYDYESYKVVATSSKFGGGKVIMSECTYKINVEYIATFADFIAGNYGSKHTFNFDGCDSGTYTGYKGKICSTNFLINDTLRDGTTSYTVSDDVKSKITNLDSLLVSSYTDLSVFEKLTDVRAIDVGNNINLDDSAAATLNQLKNVESIHLDKRSAFTTKLDADSYICQNFNSISITNTNAMGTIKDMTYTQVCN